MDARHKQLLFLALALCCAGCEGLRGDADTQPLAPAPANSRCGEQLQCAADDDAGAPSFCTAHRTCRALRSEDCRLVAGSESSPNRVLIGSLFATSGVAGAENLARQNAVQLAVDELNSGGGVPARGSELLRSLLLVACDSTREPLRAARHLLDLGAVAIVGPVEDEVVSEVAAKAALAAGTLLVSPGVTSHEAGTVWDADLRWSIAATIEQRAPLMAAALTSLEQELAAARAASLKLGVLYRDDRVGRAALATLQASTFAGASLALPSQPGGRVRIDPYPPQPSGLSDLIAAYRVFGPDVIVLIGGPEVVPELLAPIERSFEQAPLGARPHYLLSEESKGFELIKLTEQAPSLRERVRGVAAAPTEQSRPVFERFRRNYDRQFRDRGADVPGAGASYDAAYAVASALASLEVDQENGARLADALHRISAADRLLPIGARKTSSALQALAAGETIAELGSMGALRWDEQGRVRSGALELWCIGRQEEGLRYAGSGLSLDLATQTLAGRFTPCTAAAPVTTPDVSMGVPPSGPQPSAAGTPAPQTPGAPPRGPAPPRGSAGMPAPPPPQDGPTAPPEATTNTRLPCGARACALDAGELCCVSRTRTWNGTPTSLGCVQADLWGLGRLATCGMVLSCSSDSQCEPGSVCCAEGFRSRCVSPGACTARRGRRLACESQRDCPGGTVCCLHGTLSVTTACEAQCSPFQGGRQVCEEISECPLTLFGSCTSDGAPSNVKVCAGFGL